MNCSVVPENCSHRYRFATFLKSAKSIQICHRTLPTPGEAKAKAMPGRLYIHTKLNGRRPQKK